MEKLKFEKLNDDHSVLDFFKERGLEIFESDYVKTHDEMFCLKMFCENEFLGAASVYKDGDDFVLDKFAISLGHEKHGWGGVLFKMLVEEIRKSSPKKVKNLYIVTKTPGFLEKCGCIQISREQAPTYSECFTCPDFNQTCFPKVFKFEIK